MSTRSSSTRRAPLPSATGRPPGSCPWAGSRSKNWGGWPAWPRSPTRRRKGRATSAILSAVIFNAIIIPLLIPIALKGVTYRPVGADALLRRNLLVWGLGGVVLPFIGIKLIDLVLTAVHLA